MLARHTLLALLFVVPGCEASDGAAPLPAPADGVLAIAIETCAPGVLDLCYAVSVYDAPAEASGAEAFVLDPRRLVSSRKICASELGALTDVQLDLPCRSAGTGESLVEVLVESGSKSEHELMDPLSGPCTDPGRCVTQVRCAESDPVDVLIPVRFEPRSPMLQSASTEGTEDGFNDVVVAFYDRPCSARWVLMSELLHDANGDRGPTVVLNFACEGDQGGGGLQELYMSDIRIVCEGGHVSVIDPTHTARDPLTDHTGSDALSFGYQAYSGREEFYPSLAKRYWNVSIGIRADDAGQLLDSDLRNCRLEATATATEAPLGRDADGAFVTPAGVPTPIISWQVPTVIDATLAPGPVPLDTAPAIDAQCLAQGPVIATHTSLDGMRFCHHVTADGVFESCRD